MPIILTVLGFLWWWPIGLLLLGLFLGRGKFGCRRHLSYAGDSPMFNGDHGRDRWERKMTRLQEKMDMVRDRMDRFKGAGDWFGPATSGNRAFDDYRSGDVEAPRRGAAGIQGFPCPAALRQGPRRVRSVHDRATQPPLRAGFAGPTARPAARLIVNERRLLSRRSRQRHIVGGCRRARGTPPASVRDSPLAARTVRPVPPSAGSGILDECPRRGRNATALAWTASGASEADSPRSAC